MKISGIYKITNKTTNKFYIGSSNNVHHRWNYGHRGNLNKGIHSNLKLQNAWNKYGEDNFIFTILEICPIEKLLKIEQKYLNKYVGLKACYNISKDSTAPMRGRKLSANHKKKFCYSSLGKRRSKMHCKHLSEALQGNIITKEVREKISKKLMGHVQSEETKRKKSLAWRGKTNNPTKHLNENLVRKIRKMYDSSIRGNKVEIAKQLKVSYKSVCDVIYNKSWTYVV